MSLLGCFSQPMGQTLLGRRSKKALLLSCTYHDATRVGHRAAVKCLLQGSHSEFVQVQVIQGRLCQTEAPIICYKKDQQLQVIGKPKQPTCRDATALDCRIYRALFPPCIADIVKLAFSYHFLLPTLNLKCLSASGSSQKLYTRNYSNVKHVTLQLLLFSSSFE